MRENDKRIKLVVQRRIVLFSVLIFAAKTGAYFLTNSVGILTDALESTVNVMTGFISLYSISFALKPRDIDHPFGHGKIESISASIEGILIVLAGLVIIFEAVKRLFNPRELEQLDVGILIVALAGLLNYILGYFSIKTGEKHNSIALVAGGKHLQSDTYSTIGLVVGLGFLWLTKEAWLDSVIAMLFGSIIIYTGYKILKETTSNLMDEADFNLLKDISKILWENRNENWIDVSNLKLLKYGDRYHIDCDLTLPWYMNIADAHKEGDSVTQKISEHYPYPIDFTIHTDACNSELCRNCSISNCEFRSHSFENETVWTIENTIKQAVS
ncbi:cation diffusion facilitator family transporter [Labilibaculum sp. A4]|uniref:cation diffusion facilitator family transporter n=1 Tax=Labilibaculum euxinus TaxID=2686357 RepID=UPI000F61CF49|nr:cation diffusion facilitator family transporter [Labilibaculum euxinus]MDQ1770504.1 cation diffusion facilitator family transporter [Labilibaculum euxinus]MWN75277.1 cation diffusion facilitator family transporter [Labilibaculum euxinus]